MVDPSGGKGTHTEGGKARIPDLSAIRQVVEAAVASDLARCSGQTALFPGTSQAEDDEVQRTLDRLCGELLITAADPEVPARRGERHPVPTRTTERTPERNLACVPPAAPSMRGP